MDMPQNVGGVDRIVRGVLGIWLVVVAVAAVLDNRRMTAAIAAIAGILLNMILPGNDYEFGVNESGDENRGIHA